MTSDELLTTLAGIAQILYIKGKKDDELRVMADALETILHHLRSQSPTTH